MFVIPKSILLFLFIFSNYYNPLSVYLTLVVNTVLFLFFCIYGGRRSIHINLFIVVITALVLIWVMFVMVIRTDVDPQILGKYLRTTASTFLIMAICNELRVTAKQLLDILSVIFFIHIASIGMQSAFPQLDLPMAKFFGFARETEVISGYVTRKMGCSSSYDTAALISVLSMVFFFIQYAVRKKSLYLLLTFFSLLSCARTSRTGMVLGFVFFAGLFVVLFFKTKGMGRLIPVIVILCGISFSFYAFLPILVYSTGLYFSEAKDSNIVSTSDYGSTGTLDALKSTHLDAMNVPIFDLIIGFGADPNTIPNRATDIGYVKLIYHAGIVGLFLIILLYLYILRKTLIARKNINILSEEFTLSSFILFYMFLIILMNYKSLEMYSRGSHDLLLIMFFVLTNKLATNSSQNNNDIKFNHTNSSLAIDA